MEDESDQAAHQQSFLINSIDFEAVTRPRTAIASICLYRGFGCKNLMLPLRLYVTLLA